MSDEPSHPGPGEPGQILQRWESQHLQARELTAQQLVELIYQFEQDFPSVLRELHLRVRNPNEIDPPLVMLRAILKAISVLAAARMVGPAEATSDPALKGFLDHPEMGPQLDRSTLLLKSYFRLDQELQRPVHPSSVGEHRRGLFGAEDLQLLEILDELDSLAQLLARVVVVMRRKRHVRRPPAS